MSCRTNRNHRVHTNYKARGTCMQIHNPQSAIRNRKALGFSLVEIMIVVVIMGLLAGVVTVSVRGYLTKSKQATVKQAIATIVKALESFYGEYSRYPTADENLDILTRPNEKFPDPLLSGKPIDPWGKPYQYNIPGSDGHRYEVICYGENGLDGGDGVDADISSKDLQNR